jgi:outer membrane protein OmpA-like peptidoglycan-associated protein
MALPILRTPAARATALALALALAALPADAAAQGFLKKVKRAAEDAAAQGVANGVSKAASDATTGGTPKSAPAPASAAGPAAAGTTTDAAKPVRPGEGAWANYDFTPGSRALFVDDFSRDKVGDFPRRLEFKAGNMEIVEWNGGRWLRAGGEGDFALPLPEVLPERFTLEFELTGHGNAMEIHFADPATYPETQVLVFDAHQGGLIRHGIDARSSTGYDTREAPVSIRVQGDGSYVKVYVNENRVANVPNANIGRSNRIWWQLNGWDRENPRMIANLRVMAGGTDLYEAIAAEGRVATQGIYFATGSDRIQPESTPTLKEIAAMLAGHPDLSLVIEGHTDDTGAAAANQSLSERRAAAVKAALVELHGVAPDRLSTAGFGASRPAAPNATPEGRQANRRVELVRKG